MVSKTLTKEKKIENTHTLTATNCPYCHPYSGIPGDDAQEFEDLGDENNYSNGWGIDLYITHGNQLTVMASAGYYGDYYVETHPFNRINYCPMCGRPLNEEEK